MSYDSGNLNSVSKELLFGELRENYAKYFIIFSVYVEVYVYILPIAYWFEAKSWRCMVEILF
jgi:hypothetical protein